MLMTYKEARERSNLNAVEVAKKIGLSKASYSLKENYERSFKDYELMKFCQIVNCDINELVVRGFNCY